MRTTAGLALFVAVTALATTSCSSGSDDPYKPAPVWSGRKPNLPAPPTINAAPIKVGDAFTIAGASHHLRSRMHDKEVTKAPITIQGYIVEENISTAPACAVHKSGKADPEDCKSEIPSFWIADEKGAGPDKPRIRVLGWAKNFAIIFDANEKYKGLKAPPTEKQVVKDEVWQIDVPYPLPAKGAKVKVTGQYGFTFSKASGGLVSDPVNGVMTFQKYEVTEPAPEPVQLPKPGK